MQWGRSTDATLNFSIPFQKFYCITTAQESWGSATFEKTSWIVRTNSSIKWPTYMGTAINYIALGLLLPLRLPLLFGTPTTLYKTLNAMGNVTVVSL